MTVTGVGAATAATLVAEVFMRSFADRRALARFVGLTGTPDESGSRRRDRGLMKAGSARVCLIGRERIGGFEALALVPGQSHRSKAGGGVLGVDGFMRATPSMAVLSLRRGSVFYC